jgi:nucleolar protein 16
MANPRQKKKARSSISKARRKPKSKKQLLSNSVIAANWDKSETLAQNYKRLGLTRRLNKNTGGVEKKATDVGAEVVESGLVIGGTGKTKSLELGEARIERDSSTGRILRVLDEASVKANPLHDPLNHLESNSDASEVDEDAPFGQHGHANRHAARAASTPVVAELEREAARPEKKYKRRMPEGEKAFVQELVEKYGDDYEAMQRDVKINYMQRSAGDLKRRVNMWREECGVVDE